MNPKISDLRGTLSKIIPLKHPEWEGKFLDIAVKKGIIKDFLRAPRFFDEPFLLQYSAHFDNVGRSDFDVMSGSATGTSFFKERAMIKCLGETVERFCLGEYKNKKIVKGSYSRFKKNALPLGQVINFSEFQLRFKKFSDVVATSESLIGWVPGVNLTNRRKTLIPAQMVFVPYDFSNEKIVRLPISTGAASHRRMGSAIVAGLLEIIERDAFMVHYLSDTCGQQIDFEKNAALSEIEKYFKKYELDLYLIHLPIEINTNNIMALIVDRTGVGPSISVGLKSGFDPLLVSFGAIEEAFQSRPWLRSVVGNLPSDSTLDVPESKITTTESRGLYWYKKGMLKNVGKWIQNENSIDFSHITNFSKTIKNRDISEYRYLLNELKINGHEAYCVDLTNPDVRRLDFCVAKCIVPSLHPLYLDETLPYWGGSRIYELPFKLGYKSKRLTPSDINKVPHFFL